MVSDTFGAMRRARDKEIVKADAERDHALAEAVKSAVEALNDALCEAHQSGLILDVHASSPRAFRGRDEAPSVTAKIARDL